jgi:hypothetical protein
MIIKTHWEADMFVSHMMDAHLHLETDRTILLWPHVLSPWIHYSLF